MSLGDEMAAAVAGAVTTPSATAPDTTAIPDDDEFYAEGTASDTGDTASLIAVGPATRPNGVEYRPRTIGGVEDLAFLRYCRDANEHVLFLGPPGTGKTAVCEAAFAMDAKRETGPDGSDVYEHFGVETIVCSADTTVADFEGTWVQDPATGTFEWAPGPLHRAVQYDIPLYVDEIPQAEPRVLAGALYPLMDGRGVLRITTNPTLPPLPIGPGFFVIGAGNPDVPGAVMSDALRDRFHHHIEVGTDWALARQLKVPADIITVAKNLDGQRRSGTIGWSPQLRTLLAYRDSRARFGQDFALASLVSKAPAEDRAPLIDALTSKFGTVRQLAMGGQHGR